LYRNGRFIRTLDPGANWMLRFGHAVTNVDIRKRLEMIPGHEVLTGDQVGLKVSLAVQYAVADPRTATHDVESYSQAIHVAAQIALRRAVAAVSLEQLLEQKISIGEQLTAELSLEMEAIGISVHLVRIKDVMLPAEVRRAFSEVVRARQEGQAALERARGETAALRNLANAAKLLSDHPGLMDLRLLQTLATSQVGHTVVMSPESLGSRLVNRAPSNQANQDKPA
jgi:regulator of protease activity HflC (stomatin/prohibitin superfamily)